MIGPKTSIGARPHRVTFENPGEEVPDGEGGYTQGWAPLDPPALFVRIEPATGADSERVAPGTVLSRKSFIVTGPYHPQVTPETRLTFNGRIFSVTGIANRDELNVEQVLVCDEVLP